MEIYYHWRMPDAAVACQRNDADQAVLITIGAHTWRLSLPLAIRLARQLHSLVLDAPVIGQGYTTVLPDWEAYGRVQLTPGTVAVIAVDDGALRALCVDAPPAGWLTVSSPRAEWQGVLR